MSIRFQGPEESSAAEAVEAFPSKLLKALHDIRKTKGLEPFDVRDAEQLIRQINDVDNLRNGVLELFRRLSPFDSKQAKVGEVYAELDKIICASRLTNIRSQSATIDEALRAPLPTSQQGSAGVDPAWSIGPDLQKRIVELLNDIRRSLTGCPEETFYFPTTLTIVEDLIRKQSDWKTLQHAVDAAVDQIRKIGLHLQKLRDGLESGDRQAVALRSNIEIVQSKVKAQLSADSDKGLRLWFQTYAFCLADWQLERCLRLVDNDIGLPDIISLVYSVASKRLVEGSYAASQIDEMLSHLIEKVEIERIADDSTRAKLNVLRGRLGLYHHERSDAALSLFEAAQRLCPNYSLPLAAIGEYYLSQSDDERAEAQFRRSLQLPPDLVDSYLGMGRLHEQRERWEQANEWYDRAADVALSDSDAVALLEKLLAPASGCADLRLALKLVTDRPEPALRAVTRALALGIQGKGKYPRAEADRLKAEILVKLGRQEEAVEAFSEAGEFFSWRETSDDNEEARKCFEAAIQLGAKEVSSFWRLADVYLGLSYNTTDDGTKRRHVERGVAVWTAAARQVLPDESFYWAYATRSGLADQQVALLRGEDWRKRIDLWWQASTMMERLLLNHDLRALDWSFLARSFSRLYLYQNALKATEKAFELDPDNLFVAEWRMLVLCDAGHFEEALKVIEHRLKLRDDPWVYSILAWVKLHQERYQEAKDNIERAYPDIEQDRLSIWDLNLRATIYGMARDSDRAKQDWELIYKRMDQKDIGNLSSYANAAFSLGKREEAIQLLQTPILLSDPLGRDSTLRDLGLVQLRSGQTDEGWKNLEEGVSLGKEVRSLNFYVAECKEKLNLQDADRVASLVRGRVKVLEQSKTPEQELIEVYGSFGAKEHDKTWIRVGIQASLARVYREEGQWLKASNLYKQLLALGSITNDDIPPFPEARRGLELCVNNVERLGEEAFKANQAHEAIQHYEHALQLDEDSLRDETKKESAARTASLHAKLALAMLDTQGVHAASNQFATALKLYHKIDEPDSVDQLADVVKSMLRDGVHYWKVHDALHLLTADQEKAGTFRHDIATLFEITSSYLEDRYDLSFKQFETPTVSPIILEIGEELIPEDASTENWSLFTGLIPAMRRRIKEEMGLAVPGVRVRPWSSTPSQSLFRGDYRILLDEVFVTNGSVPLDRKFCPGSRAELEDAGIAIEGLESAENPRTAEMGYWLDEQTAMQAAEHKLDLWDDPLVYVIEHLEAVLRRNLGNFLGIEEVQQLLDTWKENREAEKLIDSTLKTAEDQLRFSRMLRELVNRQIPITDYRQLLDRFTNELPRQKEREPLLYRTGLAPKKQIHSERAPIQQQAGAIT